MLWSGKCGPYSLLSVEVAREAVKRMAESSLTAVSRQQTLSIAKLCRKCQRIARSFARYRTHVTCLLQRWRTVTQCCLLIAIIVQPGLYRSKGSLPGEGRCLIAGGWPSLTFCLVHTYVCHTRESCQHLVRASPHSCPAGCCACSMCMVTTCAASVS